MLSVTELYCLKYAEKKKCFLSSRNLKVQKPKKSEDSIELNANVCYEYYKSRGLACEDRAVQGKVCGPGRR